jgi:hypothetical protein
LETSKECFFLNPSVSEGANEVGSQRRYDIFLIVREPGGEKGVTRRGNGVEAAGGGGAPSLKTTTQQVDVPQHGDPTLAPGAPATAAASEDTMTTDSPIPAGSGGSEPTPEEFTSSVPGDSQTESTYCRTRTRGGYDVESTFNLKR